MSIEKGTSGVYYIKTNYGKQYIGSSKDILSAINSHFSRLKTNKHTNRHLQNTYNKYGKQCFTFGVLEVCEGKKMFMQEKHWIDLLNPEFNIDKKAEKATTKKSKKMEKVIFNEAEHSYTAEHSKKKYISATSLISNFKQPFDKVAVSTAYAAKNGGTAEEWQAKWKDISDKACEKGTKFHAKKEEEILASQGKAIISSESHSNDEGHSLYQVPAKRVSHLDWDNLTDGIKTEVVVHNHYFEIAGQVDVVTFDGAYFDIDDHKTNKKIDKYSFFNRATGKYKFMKAPLSHLMDCNYTHYALQVSEYAFMIEQLTGKKPRSLQFTHYPPDILEDDGISKEGIVYSVPYLKKEVLDMLASYTGKDISQFK